MAFLWAKPPPRNRFRFPVHPERWRQNQAGGRVEAIVANPALFAENPMRKQLAEAIACSRSAARALPRISLFVPFVCFCSIPINAIPVPLNASAPRFSQRNFAAKRHFRRSGHPYYYIGTARAAPQRVAAETELCRRRAWSAGAPSGSSSFRKCRNACSLNKMAAPLRRLRPLSILSFPYDIRQRIRRPVPNSCVAAARHGHVNCPKRLRIAALETT